MQLDRRSFITSVPALALASVRALSTQRRTKIAIEGDRFFINVRPTYAGRTYQGVKIEGLLMNSRMVQGIFDDLNPATRSRWVYPDTGKWDPQRNTREFVAAMPEWRRHGLLSFTINLQGGNPRGYTPDQPWVNSAFNPDGSLRPDYMRRLETILDRADELGMAPIVGYFYFGQDHHLRDEEALKRGVKNATEWLLRKNYANVMVETNNECDIRYHHEILKPHRVPELMELARSVAANRRRPRLLVGVSFSGGKVPANNVVAASDFVLLHGNGVKDPARITTMVDQVRRLPGYLPKPILFNEDDHFDFDQADNNMLAAMRAYASWGYYDPGENNDRDGYQSPPVDWRINTTRKKDFFRLVKAVTGS